MACPRKDPVTGVWWDGKIGTWFFVCKVAAKRGSKNCPAGTLVTETYNFNKENSLDLYMDKLLPAIVEKWPAWEERVVRIQLDSAPVHPRPGRLLQHLLDHLAQHREIGWDIDFNLQPPNPPDTNTLDLTFFRAIQAIQYKKIEEPRQAHCERLRGKRQISSQRLQTRLVHSTNVYELNYPSQRWQQLQATSCG
jgi:hypothetical protein